MRRTRRRPPGPRPAGRPHPIRARSPSTRSRTRLMPRPLRMPSTRPSRPRNWATMCGGRPPRWFTPIQKSRKIGSEVTKSNVGSAIDLLDRQLVVCGQGVPGGHRGAARVGPQRHGLQARAVERANDHAHVGQAVAEPRRRVGHVAEVHAHVHAGAVLAEPLDGRAPAARSPPAPPGPSSAPVVACPVALVAATARSAASSTTRASSSRTVPASVSSTLRVVRSSSWTSIRSSSRLIWALRACCAMCSRLAAWVKFSSSATATNAAQVLELDVHVSARP